MTKRYVSLPGVRNLRVPLGAYVKGWKMAKAHPDATFKHSLTSMEPTTGAECLREFREGLHDRINTKGGVWAAYRPWLAAFRWSMHRDVQPTYVLLRRMLTTSMHFRSAIRAVQEFMDEWERGGSWEDATTYVRCTLREGWLRADPNGTLHITRKGKRFMRKRIVALTAVH